MIESLVLPMWRGVQHTAYRVTGDDAQKLTGSYIFVGDGWCVQAVTRGERVALAGIPEPFDFAVPQPWLDEHTAEVAQRGGWVIWTYPQGASLFGEPMFADEIEKRAAKTVAMLIAEASA